MLSALVVKPPPKVALVGIRAAVMVTGYGFELAIVTTTSPVPPGYKRFPAAGEATAVIVKLAVLADWASPAGSGRKSGHPICCCKGAPASQEGSEHHGPNLHLEREAGEESSRFPCVPWAVLPRSR